MTHSKPESDQMLCLTAEEMIEGEIRSHAEQYRMMLATNLFGFLLVDAAGKLIDVNEAYCRMSGYSREEILQLSIFDVEAAESAEDNIRHMERVIAAGIDHFESRHIGKNGWVFCVEISAAYLRSQDSIIAFVRDISDRIIMEAELRDSEVRYHAVVEDQTNLICRYRPDGRISFVNEAYLRYFGKTRNQLINKNYIPHIPEPDLSIILAQLKGITPDRPIVTVEHRVILADGTIRWLHWTHRGVYSPEASIIEYQAVGSDITENKQYVLDRELNEIRLRLLLQLNTLTAESEGDILDFTLEAVLDTVQSRFAFIGFVDDAETVLTIHKWSKGAMAQCIMDSTTLVMPLLEVGLLGECVRARVPIVMNDYAAAHPRKNGCPVGHVPITRFLGIPVFDNNRIVAVATAANKDDQYTQSDVDALTLLIENMFSKISRLRIEETLRANNKKLKAYMDNSFDVIFVLNAEGNFTFVSKSWEKHFGFPIKEVIGKNFAMFVHPEDIQACAEYLAEILNVGQSKTSPPYRVKRSDGEWRCFVANGSRFYDVNNNAWHYIGAAHDMTSQLEAEKLLLQAKASSDAANMAKSEFLATMSHEIRTPLSALLGNIELLESSQLAPEQHEHLKDCRTASEMLLHVINDVLDFSKIEAGKLELVNESFSVCYMARQLVRAFASSAEQKGVNITLSLAEDLPAHIYADQHRLRQIISNLLSNAIKFTDYGTVSLEIVMSQPTSGSISDKVDLMISVRDTGSGIAPDAQAAIFDSFTQVENFNTRRHAGTGLGLAICRRLAEMMGGTVTLSSVPGEGSLFTLSLSVTVCRPPRQQRVQRAEAGAATPRNILLADDEELGRAVTAALLRRRGHHVTTVENGAALLDALQRQKYDIVLSDISMPDMDGMEVAQIIRSGARIGIDSMVPIIAMTAHAFIQDQARFLASGINGYASKPVNFENLLRQIDELCCQAAEQSAVAI